MMITQMDGVKDPADFWSAIGGKLRPSFVVTVTVSLPIFEPSEPEGAPLVTARRIDIGERTSPDEMGIMPETLSSTEIKDLKPFGTVTTGADRKPVKAAIVTISELDLQTTTGIDGRYSLGVVPRGQYQTALGLIEASGSIMGSNQLVPGKVIKITGAGNRFSGRYYVASATHRIDHKNGYRTNFTARRNSQ